MLIIVSKYFLGRHFVGIALWPFIVVNTPNLKEDKVFINHEKIHIRQQAELLVIPFYIFYLLEYSIRLLQYRNLNKAYQNISFEREAYCNETNLAYLKKRKMFGFINYL